MRLSPRAADHRVDALVGIPSARRGGVTATSSGRSPGDLGARASATLDGDRRTAWVNRPGPQLGAWVDVQASRRLTIRALELTVVADGEHSVPTRLGVTLDGVRLASLRVPAVADRPERGATRTVELPLPATARGSRVRIEVEEVRRVTGPGPDGRPTTRPVALAELGIGGLRVPDPPRTLDTGCRRDLVSVDGRTVGVRIRGPVAAALRGEPLELRTCRGGPVRLPAGASALRVAPGRDTGLDVDRLVLRSGPDGKGSRAGGPLADEAPGPDASRPPEALVVADGDAAVDVTIRGARAGEPFWLVLAQSRSQGWQATVDGEALGEPVLVDGYANGWRVTPRGTVATVDLRFGPQRVVDAALVVSTIAALVCVVLAITGAAGRLRRPREDELPLALSPFLVRNYDGRLPTRRRARTVAVALSAAGAALVSPAVGLALGIASYRALRDDRMRRWFVAGAPAAMAVAGGYVLAWQIRYDIAPGPEWPSAFHRAHPVAWSAVLVLVADTVIDRIWSVPADAH